MPAVDECERDVASAAGMIAMIGAGTVQPPPWMANGGRRGQVPRSGRKPSRGAFIRSTGANGRPSGCGRSARTSPMLGTKPSTGGVGGEWRLTWTSSRIWDESRSDGRLFSSQRQMPAIGLKTTYERQARTSFRVRDENRPERRLSGFSRAEGMRPSWRVYSPVTRIQSPIKEKT